MKRKVKTKAKAKTKIRAKKAGATTGWVGATPPLPDVAESQKARLEAEVSLGGATLQIVHMKVRAKEMELTIVELRAEIAGYQELLARRHIPQSLWPKPSGR